MGLQFPFELGGRVSKKGPGRVGPAPASRTPNGRRCWASWPVCVPGNPSALSTEVGTSTPLPTRTATHIHTPGEENSAA